MTLIRDLATAEVRRQKRKVALTAAERERLKTDPTGFDLWQRTGADATRIPMTGVEGRWYREQWIRARELEQANNTPNENEKEDVMPRKKSTADPLAPSQILTLAPPAANTTMSVTAAPEMSALADAPDPLDLLGSPADEDEDGADAQETPPAAATFPAPEPAPAPASSTARAEEGSSASSPAPAAPAAPAGVVPAPVSATVASVAPPAAPPAPTRPTLFDLQREYLETIILLDTVGDAPKEFQAGFEDALEEQIGELAKKLEDVDLAIDVKAEGWAKFIHSVEADGEKAKVEAERLARRASSFERSAKRLREVLKTVLINTGKTNVKTGLFTIYVAPSKPRVVVKDVRELPGKFLKPPAAPEPDREAILAFWKEKKTAPSGAEIDTTGRHLVIR